jgi:OOP family OmpA-OmpF porin
MKQGGFAACIAVVLFLSGCAVMEPAPAPKAERTIVLDNILFDFGKAAVTPEAAKALDRLVAFLKENRDKRVELEGHTDAVGRESYNLRLSGKRAGAVKDYLVKRAIEASRISVQGFGGIKPIADGKTEAGRARNRRVEIKVR